MICPFSNHLIFSSYGLCPVSISLSVPIPDALTGETGQPCWCLCLLPLSSESWFCMFQRMLLDCGMVLLFTQILPTRAHASSLGLFVALDFICMLLIAFSMQDLPCHVAVFRSASSFSLDRNLVFFCWNRDTSAVLLVNLLLGFLGSSLASRTQIRQS